MKQNITVKNTHQHAYLQMAEFIHNWRNKGIDIKWISSDQNKPEFQFSLNLDETNTETFITKMAPVIDDAIAELGESVILIYPIE